MVSIQDDDDDDEEATEIESGKFVNKTRETKGAKSKKKKKKSGSLRDSPFQARLM